MSSSSESTSSNSRRTVQAETIEGHFLPASHVAYLNLKLNAFQKASTTEQKKIANDAGLHLCKEVEMISKERLSKKKSDSLKEAVREWFRQHQMPERRSGKKKTWRTNWHVRLVFQHLRSHAIMFLAKVLWFEADEPDLRKLLDFEDKVIGQDEQGLDDLAWAAVDSDDEDAGGSKARTGPFSKYQTATTLLWNELTDQEKDTYHGTAAKWKLERLPEEERQREVCDEALLLFRSRPHEDLDVRVHFLIAYKNSKGEPKGVELEFTEQFGAGEEFRNKFKPEIRESGVLELWRQYASFTFGDDAEDMASIGGSFKKPLMVLKCNEYNEPILPSLTTKPDSITRGAWLTQVLCAFFTGHYALARGTPNIRPNVPWKHLSAHLRDFISEEIVPDDKAHLITEPTNLNVETRQELFLHLFHRQHTKLIPTFEFHHWIDKSKTCHPRFPRVLREEPSESDNEEYDMEILKESIAQKGKQKDTLKKQAKPPTNRKSKKLTQAERQHIEGAGSESEDSLLEKRADLPGKKITAKTKPKIMAKKDSVKKGRYRQPTERESDDTEMEDDNLTGASQASSGSHGDSDRGDLGEALNCDSEPEDTTANLGAALDLGSDTETEDDGGSLDNNSGLGQHLFFSSETEDEPLESPRNSPDRSRGHRNFPTIWGTAKNRRKMEDKARKVTNIQSPSFLKKEEMMKEMVLPRKIPTEHLNRCNCYEEVVACKQLQQRLGKHPLQLLPLLRHTPISQQ
ncbi:hypothetical protein BKA70DRAFT_1226588 [Coprinopsis sp. MPI-PUGE-AT-0042]|nr:hypothetical protein BKA70DRAFT_1226588 [Coprinopsis sp. MPI-PUGE-AT-0042]